MAFPKTGNDFIDTYMEMVENTESPRMYHVWCAISCVGAALGRRCFLPFGHSVIYPNEYVLLVGNAGTRKSTAMGVAKSILAEATDVRFSPDSTGGRHQGLVTAMRGPQDEEDDDLKKQVDKLIDDFSATDIGNITFGNPTKRLNIAQEDKQVLYTTASEFNIFIGHNNIEFLEFLGKVYDGEPYDYQLKNEQISLAHPLMNLIGCTTSTNIATAMPPEAIGQGFMSRIILVYGDKKYKKVSRPTPFDQGLRSKLQSTLRQLYFQFSGPFRETQEALDYQDSIYDAPSELIDSRFTYYLTRRHTHMLKLAMILAAMKGSLIIGRDDYMLANSILLQTEQHMPDALGEYGTSPISIAKQKIVEYVRAVDMPVTSNMLWHMLSGHIKLHEFEECMRDLVGSGKIVRERARMNGSDQTVYIPATAYQPDTLELMDALSTSTGTGTVQ